MPMLVPPHANVSPASALFLNQSDLSIPHNSQSQVVRMRMDAVCSTLVEEVGVLWAFKRKSPFFGTPISIDFR